MSKQKIESASVHGIPAIIPAALIGFSRLYPGVHYSNDVLCGIISGYYKPVWRNIEIIR